MERSEKRANGLDTEGADGPSRLQPQRTGAAGPHARLERSEKRANGLEPSTFSLEGCKPSAQTTANTDTSSGDTATPSSSPGSRGGNPALDDHLRRLIDAWPTLPEPMRAGILAMVEAAAKNIA